MSDDLLLPAGTRLFHVGPPKTGTTALQEAAAKLRPELLAAGVRYPGQLRNHRLAVQAVLGRARGFRGEMAQLAPPAMRHWYTLLGELESERRRRTWFGHEYAAHADEAVIRRFADELGPALHVVITLRSYAQMLPSMWQEQLKGAGGRATFESFLRAMLTPSKPREVERRARVDQAAMVQRWVDGLGADRVSVVVLDRRDHGFVFRTFERLLGLPDGLLTSLPETTGQNRSLTVDEVELLRRVNRVTRDAGLPWRDHELLVVRGGAQRILRNPPAGAPLLLPKWAREPANAEAVRVAEAVRASGARILGDVADLAEPAKQGEALDHRKAATVPLEVAVNALAGTVASAIGRHSDFTVSADRVGRLILTHLVDDWRAIREVGLPVLLDGALRRGSGAVRGAGYAVRGALASRRAHGERRSPSPG